MITEEENFAAISDRGDRFVVVKLQHWTEFRASDGKVERRRGSYEWKTACGIDLDEKADGTFEMIQIDGILNRL